MNRAAKLSYALVLLAVSGAAGAQTPDGETPAAESNCDYEYGAAYGFCVAFCEAMDCDSPFAQASDEACDRLHDNYTQVAGIDPPCVPDGMCIDGFGFWAVCNVANEDNTSETGDGSDSGIIGGDPVGVL